MKKIILFLTLTICSLLFVSCQQSKEDKIKKRVISHYENLFDYVEKVEVKNLSLVSVDEKETIYNVTSVIKNSSVRGIATPTFIDCVEVTYNNEYEYIVIGGPCK